MKYKLCSVMIIIYLICIASPALAESIEIKRESCWFYHHDGTGNQLNLCLTGEVAEMNIYYPNFGHAKPTTCQSNGKAVWKAGHREVVIEFWPGPCKNGRSSERTRMECVMTHDQGLDCIDHRANKVLFQHVKSGT